MDQSPLLAVPVLSEVARYGGKELRLCGMEGRVVEQNAESKLLPALASGSLLGITACRLPRYGHVRGGFELPIRSILRG